MVLQFDEGSPAIINPLFCGKVPERVVSTFSKVLIDRVARLPGVEKVGAVNTVSGEYPIYRIRYAGEELGFYMSPVGAPACVAVAEDIAASGMKKLVLFGSCGVLDASIPEGNILVPDSAVRDEGTSFHYAPAGEEIQLEACAADTLCGVLGRNGIAYRRGKTWTTDAPYRETRQKTAERREQGCICVEMECASMAAFAAFRSLRFAQFFFSADNLDAPEWEPRGLSDHERIEKEEYMELAFECALAL